MKNLLLNKRFLEIVTGSASLIIILFLFIGSFVIPFVIAVIVIAFDCYWLYKSFWFAVNSIRVYQRMYYNSRFDWRKENEKLLNLDKAIEDIQTTIDEIATRYRIKRIPGILRPLLRYSFLRKPYIDYRMHLSVLKEYRSLKKNEDKIVNPNEIHHVVIIPEWKEPIDVLEATISKIAEQDMPLNQISVVLATELRDPEADATIEYFVEKYKDVFAHFWYTRHPIVTGEVIGKSSNMAYAGKWVEQELLKEGYDLKKVTVTSCDADSLLPKSYYSYVTYKFASDGDREYHFYHGAMMYYENFWEVPFPIRMLVTSSSIWNLSHLINDSLLPLSTYTLCFDSVKRAGYWSVDVVPEDFHIFFKTFFALGQKVKVVPIYLPIYASAPQSTTYWKTLKNQYSQMKRWAWGISDDQYLIREAFIHKEIPLIVRVVSIFRPLEEHIFWPVNWVIITIGANLPLIFNRKFNETSLGYRLPFIAQIISSICLLALLTVIIVESKVRPKPRVPWKWWKKPALILQWVSLPVVSLFLSAIPGIDAHTRLLLGKRLEYKVTDKVRQTPS